MCPRRDDFESGKVGAVTRRVTGQQSVTLHFGVRSDVEIRQWGSPHPTPSPIRQESASRIERRLPRKILPSKDDGAKCLVGLPARGISCRNLRVDQRINDKIAVKPGLL